MPARPHTARDRAKKGQKRPRKRRGDPKRQKAPKRKVTPEERQHFLRRFSRDLLEMGRLLVPDMFTAASAPFHSVLSGALTDLSRRFFAICCPRGHAKSSIGCVLLVIWHLFIEDHVRRMLGLPTWQGPKFIGIWSKTEREAKKRLKTIKSVLGNEQGQHSRLLRLLFGNWGFETARSYTATEIELKDGSVILASGMGQQGRGLLNYFSRLSLGILDDPEDENNTKTDEAMDSNERFVLQVIIPALHPTLGRLVVIATPINTQSLVTRLQKAEGYTALYFQNDAETDSCKYYAPSHEDASADGFVRREGVLWGAYITRDTLLALLAMARSQGKLSSYYREHEAKIVGDEDQIFHVEDERYWDGSLERDALSQPYVLVTHRGASLDSMAPLAEPELVPVYLTLGVDPGQKAAATSDPSAMVPLGRCADKHRYVLPYLHRRLGPGDQTAALARKIGEIRPERSLIEENNAEYLKDIRDAPYNLRRGIFFIFERQKKKGANSRLERVQPVQQAHRLHLHVSCAALRDEMRSYPRGADDLLDALEKADRAAGSRRPTHSVVLEAAPEDQEERLAYHDPMLA